MTVCLRLSERIPEVAVGRSEWTRNEREHLAGCPSCRREWELVQLTRSLSHEQLPRFDTQAMTRTLQERLQRSRRQRRARRVVWGLGGLGLAASLTAVLWIGPADRAPSISDPAPSTSGSLATRLEIPLPELEGLEPVELDSVLNTMDEPLAADSAVDPPELGDFDSGELETVLDIWEG
jgi:hypothetical protein